MKFPEHIKMITWEIVTYDCFEFYDGELIINFHWPSIAFVFFRAVYVDDRDKLEAFHVAGVDLGTADYRGNTALHLVILF